MVPALASVWHQGELCTVASGFHVTAPGVAEQELVHTSVTKEAQLPFSASDPCLMTLNILQKLWSKPKWETLAIDFIFEVT